MICQHFHFCGSGSKRCQNSCEYARILNVIRAVWWRGFFFFSLASGPGALKCIAASPHCKASKCQPYVCPGCGNTKFCTVCCRLTPFFFCSPPCFWLSCVSYCKNYHMGGMYPLNKNTSLNLSPGEAAGLAGGTLALTGLHKAACWLAFQTIQWHPECSLNVNRKKYQKKGSTIHRRAHSSLRDREIKSSSTCPKGSA